MLIWSLILEMANWVCGFGLKFIWVLRVQVSGGISDERL